MQNFTRAATALSPVSWVVPGALTPESDQGEPKMLTRQMYAWTLSLLQTPGNLILASLKEGRYAYSCLSPLAVNNVEPQSFIVVHWFCGVKSCKSFFRIYCEKAASQAHSSRREATNIFFLNSRFENVRMKVRPRLSARSRSLPRSSWEGACH